MIAVYLGISCVIGTILSGYVKFTWRDCLTQELSLIPK